jgi:2-oxoisovalerate dehydrogenase E1 component alpha subunit
MKNTPSLSLHVPEPTARPGDAVDFGRLNFGVGEDCPPKPELGVSARETAQHAFGLIRVLDDEGKASGPWNPKVDPETLRRGLKAMITTRVFDERMFRQARPAST